jgi:hypothetical protein
MLGARALLFASGIVEHLGQTLQTACISDRIVDALQDVRVVGEDLLPWP